MKKYRFHILIGLPGSGKTYWANNQFHKEHSKGTGVPDMFEVYHNVIDLDSTMDGYDSLEDALLDEYDSIPLTERREFYGQDPKEVNTAIDGLLLTKESVIKVIDCSISYLKENEKNKYTVEFLLHIWDMNRQQCLANDNLRVMGGQREQLSETTIKHGVIDKMSADDFAIRTYKDKSITYKRVSHKVPQLTDFDIIFRNDADCIQEEHGEEKLYITSDVWSEGGTWGSCYDDELHTIQPESPAKFKQFDEFIEKICPNISHKDYQKLYNATVELEDYSTGDWYGGHETKAYYKCDLRKLYNEIKKLNIKIGL